MTSKRMQGATESRVRRVFSDEFTMEAVRLMTERRAAGVPLTQVARQLDVSARQLRDWARAQHGGQDRGAVVGETADQELRRLRREIAVLRQEQAFAKKVAVYFARESR